MNPSRFFALIPCAGNGSRAGTAGPKQYERVAGQPMIWHTLSAFAGVKRIARTLVVVAPGDGFFERNPTTSALVVPCGGATRAASAEVVGLRSKKPSPGATTTSVRAMRFTPAKADSVCQTMGWPPTRSYCLGPAVPARLPLPAQGMRAK